MQRCMIGSCSVCMVGESLPGRRRQRSSETPIQKHVPVLPQTHSKPVSGYRSTHRGLA